MRYVKAIFSDGTVRVRGSVRRHYTHAWYARWSYAPERLAEITTSLAERFGAHFRPYPPDYVADLGGFSASEEQCDSNKTAETAWVAKNGATFSVREVVPVVEITEREYREHQESAK
jgi:hypothetical protein